MRKKLFMAFMMVAAISLAGCGKKTTATEVQTTPEPTAAPTTTEDWRHSRLPDRALM